MRPDITKFSLLLLLILLVSFNCLCQVNENTQPVKLIKWTSEDCDRTYDPNRLVTRITRMETKDGITTITVNFPENCCVSFDPKINYTKNKLTLMPYEAYKGDYCTCNCCFSITFEIAGLTGKAYEIFFNQTPIIQSADHYTVIQPSSQSYLGKEINRRNKYGFKEGTWITFHKNGKIDHIKEYPAIQLYYELDPLWSKRYYPSQKLRSYERKDTSEDWFEDGELQYQRIEYKSGDTSYEKGLRKFSKRQFAREYAERRYDLKLKSEFDSTYEGEGSIGETIYETKYFENGDLEYRFGKDTSYSWFRNGQVAFKRYGSGSMDYDEAGRATKRNFYWVEPGPIGNGDLEHSIYITYHKNGVIEEIHFVRSEADATGIGNNHYHWQWNDKMKLIASPKGWKEPLPWKRFKEIELPLPMYKGL